jgi:hypothetical protein
MAWVYLDDQFFDHPKIARAGGDAAWLFVCGLGYVRRHETAGRIPKAQVTRLSDRKAPNKLAQVLVDVNLWEDDGDFYLVHDYHQWNKPQESRSAAGRKAAMARWSKDKPTEPAAPPSHAERNAIASETHVRNGETADASGCPPPRPRPRVGTSSSNTRLSRPPSPTPEAPAEEEILTATFDRLARHDLNHRLHDGHRISTPDRWLTTAAQRRREAHHDRAQAELAANPRLTADQLAEILDPACGPEDGGKSRADLDVARTTAERHHRQAIADWTAEADRRLNDLDPHAYDELHDQVVARIGTTARRAHLTAAMRAAAMTDTPHPDTHLEETASA